ncbi:MAG: hypothetical protein ACE5GE_09540 [Phycisphaerae bacterium]
MKVNRIGMKMGLVVLAAMASPTVGQEFHLLTSNQYARLWPSVARSVIPQAGCCAADVFDGDRLMGTLPLGPVIQFVGTGTPLFDPNAFGALSFTLRRGSVSAPGVQIPILGIDFLGGPLLDLDGDLNNPDRSLVPVLNQTPVTIPGTSSLVDLTLDTAGGVVTLNNFDATGTSEGGQQIPAGTATTVNIISGTLNDATVTGAVINPGVDTRSGSLLSFAGTGGTVNGVFRIDNLGYELWQDTALANSATADTLGTFQFLGFLRGWYIERDPNTGQFPTLGGQGLGGTLWPLVDTSQIGQTFVTANGLATGSATILTGFPADDFTVAGNGGLAMTDLGGDLGAYFDNVVVPLIHPLSDSFVYLESAGFGINNSADPVFLDTVGYDLVLVAQQAPIVDGDADNSGTVDLFDSAELQNCFTGQGPAGLAVECLVFDFDFDDDNDLLDHAEFVTRMAGPQ